MKGKSVTFVPLRLRVSVLAGAEAGQATTLLGVRLLTRGSRPEAAIIPYSEFTQFLAWKEREVVGEFDRAVLRLAERNARYGDDEITADVDDAIAEVRKASAT